MTYPSPPPPPGDISAASAASTSSGIAAAAAPAAAGSDIPIHDVAVIGYGPTGETLANCLGQAGLSVVVIEREAEICTLPRAIHCDGEVMRAFQSLGLRTGMEAISRPGMASVFKNPAGETLMVRNANGEIGPHGCANSYYYHQPDLERVLRDGAARHAGLRVLLQHEVLDIADDGGPAATLRVRDLGSGRDITLRARYVVGCDGSGPAPAVAGVRRAAVRRRPGAAAAHGAALRPGAADDVLQRDRQPPALGNHADARRRSRHHRAA